MIAALFHRALACLPVFLLAVGARAAPLAKVVMDVDSANREMKVLRDGRIVAVFDYVSVGRWGLSEAKRRGDGKTPLGEYRIAWLKSTGQFGAFMGVDYPSVARAEKGLATGEISQTEYNAIRQAHADGRIPPQDTALGGQIGIHGLGRADPRTHRELNWTKGCIALTNEQMRQLMHFVGKGALVRIH